jgi:agmatine/peptidylarginine deiminase
MFAKFLSPNTLLVGQYEGHQDSVNARILDRNAELLEQASLEEGHPISIIRIPMGANSDGIFRTFTNSLYVNHTVILPTYEGHRQLELEAAAIYRQYLPKKTRIAAINVDEIMKQDGAIHCITQTLNYVDHRPADEGKDR